MDSALIFAVLLAMGLSRLVDRSFAQASFSQSGLVYTLLKGSQLEDDCPVCDHLPIVVPMSGTFRLRLLAQNPLYTQYQLLEIAFTAGSTNGPLYRVTGSGTYQVGGEVALVQDLWLAAQVNNGLTNLACGFTNAQRTVAQPWPSLQISVDQTNGTVFQVYHLILMAAPALQFTSLMPDAQTGNVRLDWLSNGAQVQLERATNAAGPYTPLTPPTTNQSYLDVGAFTNLAQSYYRLRQ